MKNFIILILLIFSLSCNREECVISSDDNSQLGWQTFIADAGKFAVSPTIGGSQSGQLPEGRYDIRLIEGFNNYSLEPYSENHDWMKLAGAILCQFCFNDQDNIMLVVRYLPDQDSIGQVPDVNEGKIQISFFFNIDGQRYDRWSPYFNEDYDLVEVKQDSLISFWWNTKPGEVTAGIDYGDSTHTVIQPHTGVAMYQRPLSGWMGGTTKPVTKKVFERRLICGN